MEHSEEHKQYYDLIAMLCSSDKAVKNNVVYEIPNFWINTHVSNFCV